MLLPCRRPCVLRAVFVCLAVLGFGFVGTGPVRAQDIYDWNPNGNPTGGSGLWDTSSASWLPTFGGPLQAWPNGNTSFAQFGGTGGTVTLDGGSSLEAGALIFNADGYVLTGGGLQLVPNQSTNTPFIAVTNPGQTATINSGIFSGLGFTKTGAGTLVLGGGNTFGYGPGATYDGVGVTQGTLQLNAATGSIDSTAFVNLGFSTVAGVNSSGCTFVYDNTGATTATQQTLGGVQVFSGDNVIRTNHVADQSIFLTLGTISPRGTGSTQNFVVSGGTNGVDNGIQVVNPNDGSVPAGFIDQGSFFNGSAYAWIDPSTGLVRALVYGVDPDTTTFGNTDTVSGIHVQTTGAVSAQQTATLLTLNLAGISTAAGANDFTLADGQILTLNGILKTGGTSATISGGAGLQAGVQPSSNYPYGTSAELVIRVDQPGDSLTISTPILASANDDPNTNALTKSGPGTLTLTADNTYTGTTYLNGGALSIPRLADTGTPGPLGTGGGGLQINGGTLQYTGLSVSTNRTGTVGLGGGTLEVTRADATLQLNGQWYGPNTSLSSDSLVKTGPGTLVLGGNDDNGGLAITVAAGTLLLNKGDASATAANLFQVNAGATARITGTTGNQIYDGGVVIVQSGGTFDLNGQGETIGTLSGSGLVTNTAAGTLSNLAVGVYSYGTPSPPVSFGGVLADGAGGGQIGLTVNGGTLVLSGTNTYSGGTTVNYGLVQLAGSGTLGAPRGALTVGYGQVDLNGTSQRVGALGGYGYGYSVIYNGSAGTTSTLTVGTGNGGGSYLGTLEDNPGTGGLLALTKTGTGTQVLNGNMAYTGLTTINGGTLEFDAAFNGTNASSGGALKFTNTGTFNANDGYSGHSYLNATTYSAGEATVQSTFVSGNGVNVIELKSLPVRSTGATVNYVASGGTSTTNDVEIDNKSGFIDQGSFFNGSNYAYADSTFYNAVRGIKYSGTGKDANAFTTGTSNTTSISATSNYLYVQASSNVTAQTSATFTTLNISGSKTLTMASGKTLTVNGILKSGNNAGYIAQTSGSGSIRAATDAEMVIRTDGASDTLTVSTPIVANGSNALTKSGAGTLTLSGANTYTGGTYINAGTLAASGAGTNKTLGTTSSVTVNLSGTLLFGANSQATGTTPITLAGGTIKTVSGTNQGSSTSAGLGALTLTLASSLDFSGAPATLSFASFNPGGADNVLTVTGYGSGDHLYFNQNQAGNLGNFDFGAGPGVNVGEIASGSFFEIAPIPEPATWLSGAAVALLGVIAWRRAQRPRA